MAGTYTDELYKLLGEGKYVEMATLLDAVSLDVRFSLIRRACPAGLDPASLLTQPSPSGCADGRDPCGKLAILIAPPRTPRSEQPVRPRPHLPQSTRSCVHSHQSSLLPRHRDDARFLYKRIPADVKQVSFAPHQHDRNSERGRGTCMSTPAVKRVLSPPVSVRLFCSETKSSLRFGISPSTCGSGTTRCGWASFAHAHSCRVHRSTPAQCAFARCSSRLRVCRGPFGDATAAALPSSGDSKSLPRAVERGRGAGRRPPRRAARAGRALALALLRSAAGALLRRFFFHAPPCLCSLLQRSSTKGAPASRTAAPSSLTHLAIVFMAEIQRLRDSSLVRPSSSSAAAWLSCSAEHTPQCRPTTPPRAWGCRSTRLCSVRPPVCRATHPTRSPATSPGALFRPPLSPLFPLLAERAAPARPLSSSVVLSLGWELDAESGLLKPCPAPAAARGMPTVEHLHKMVEYAVHMG